ncbi:MAG: DNA alkylation repair protein [Ignavibacteriales bacterium]|nr:DNA alkylation repair protein [Ignavibacteriales bacterium]
MTVDQIGEWLHKNQNERGIKVWERLRYSDISTYGIGLTQLRKFAKGIKKDAKLAKELWEMPNYDMKIISILVDEPKKLTRERLEEQIKDLDFWMLSYAYTGSFLAVSPIKSEIAYEWLNSRDNIKRRIAFSLIVGVLNAEKPLNEEFASALIDRIEAEIQSEENFVKDQMNYALFGLGKMTKALHTKALAVAKKIGKVEVDYGDNSCEAPDCVKHLTSPRVLESFA